MGANKRQQIMNNGKNFPSGEFTSGQPMRATFTADQPNRAIVSGRDFGQQPPGVPIAAVMGPG